MDNSVKTTWVVVAQQAGARFMEHKSGFGRHLIMVRELENPDGRKRNHEIDSDRPGEASSGGRGTMRRAMQHEETAHEHIAKQFANTVANELSKARASGAFVQLVLVAEPGFLGLLREALDKPTSALVIDSVAKNLSVERPNEVAAHLGNALPL
jgi:protein required for attachment to host cells